MRLPISTIFLTCLINRMIHTFPIRKTDLIRFGGGRGEMRVGGTLLKKFQFSFFPLKAFFFFFSFLLLKCAILQTGFASALRDSNMELNQERNGKCHIQSCGKWLNTTRQLQTAPPEALDLEGPCHRCRHRSPIPVPPPQGPAHSSHCWGLWGSRMTTGKVGQSSETPTTWSHRGGILLKERRRPIL